MLARETLLTFSERRFQQAAQKDLRGKAREFDGLRRTFQYVEASRASATKHMSPFQQPATEALR